MCFRPVSEISDIRYATGDPEDFCYLTDIDTSFESDHLQIGYYLSFAFGSFLVFLILTLFSYFNSMILLRKLTKALMGVYSFDSSKLLVYPIGQLITYLPGGLMALTFFMKWIEASIFFDELSPYTLNLKGLINLCTHGALFFLNRKRNQRNESMDYEPIEKGSGLSDSVVPF